MNLLQFAHTRIRTRGFPPTHRSVSMLLSRARIIYQGRRFALGAWSLELGGSPLKGLKGRAWMCLRS